MVNTGEKNKLRTYAKLCDGYIIKKPIFFQCDIPWHLKRALSKFIIGNHNLLIEKGRHLRPKIPLELRLCNNCDTGTIDDKIHFLTSRPVMDDLRR